MDLRFSNQGELGFVGQSVTRILNLMYSLQLHSELLKFFKLSIALKNQTSVRL